MATFQGDEITLKSQAEGGFVFGAYRVKPGDARRGGLVLIQEIFGVTDHIRALADGFAEDGYEVVAPSLFDRFHPDFRASYEQKDIATGRLYSESTKWDQVEGDLAAAVAMLAPPVFAVGYCWGGTAAWLAAYRLPVAAASCYYGRRIPELLDETPRCPTVLHFGRSDPTIPPAVVEEIAEAHPDLPIHVYEAGHGFASDRPADYDPDSARLARLRTLQLFHQNSGSKAEMGG